MDKIYEIEGEQLVVKSDIPFLTLLEMEINQRENEHGSLTMHASLADGERERVLHTDWSDAKIVILRKGQEDSPLFHGRIGFLACQEEDRILTVEISAIGETASMDRAKKTQSFQNCGMTYRQVIREVIKGYDNADFIWNAGEERELQNPVVQYEETDWEFLRRLCSHFHMALFPDLKTGNADFFFGIRQGQEKMADGMEIVGSGFDSSYYQDGGSGDGVPGSHMLYLEVRTKENWQIGDYILYNGRKYVVCRRRISFADGELLFAYHLKLNGNCYQKRMQNPALAGARLEGTVRRTEEETVCIQLDADAEERAEYPWEWAPETNNLCYCMPETGTKATLYFPTAEEKDGQVVLAAVKGQGSRGYCSDQYRHFATAEGKKLGLYPKRISLTGKGTKVSLGDTMGIQLSGSNAVSFSAGGNIRMEGKRCSITAPLEVVCQMENANIEICRDFNFYAAGGVSTIGTGDGGEREEVPAADKVRPQESRNVEHWQASYSALAAVPAADFSQIRDTGTVVDMFACGSVPKVAKGSTTIAMSEAMAGKKESETSFPKAFRSMECYTVKGGYALPKKEK